jgi:hypothetical protein
VVDSSSKSNNDMISVIRKFICLIYLVLISSQLCAQNVGINSTGLAPDASAMLDIVATDKGLLIPRVALTATNVAAPVTSPATSLLVYNTATAGTSPNNVVPGYYYWNGSAWVALLTASNTTWTLTGNSGTTAGTNFIGTTDAVDFVTKTNNTERARVSSSGNFRVGTAAFNVTNPEKLLIDAGTTSSVNAIVGKGSIDSYLQLNIQNQSTGTSSSSDVVATANNGSETTNYVDMGINGQNYSGGIMGTANDAYLYNIGQNLLIGTGTAAKSLVFMTGGTSQSTNERMRINGSGNVGIGTSTFSGTNPERLIVNAGSSGGTAFQNVIVGKGNTNSYAQLNIQNQSNGTASSSDVVATANNGSETTNYIDMGINGGSNSSTGILGGANTAYLYSAGADFAIGNSASTSDLLFFTGGIAASNERMRIDNDGNVGIGITADPDVKVLVDAGTSIESAVFASGDINSFLEINVQNSNNGNLASSDVVATANNGTDNSVYVDMGINSAGYSNNGGVNSLLNGANTAYLYAHGNDFKIGNGTPNKPLVFFTNPSSGSLGTNTAHGVERIRIAQDGKVGIGDYSAADPNSTLSVTGSVGYAITTTNSNLTLDDTHHTVIITGGSPTITLPTAGATNSRRVYVIVNQTGSGVTIGSYQNFSGAGTTTVAANSSITIQSNGTNWYRIQ